MRLQCLMVVHLSLLNHGIIELATQKNDDRISIKVRDNGYGIEKKNLKKILEPFYTTKKSGDGTGLGLFITQSIVEEHRGEIRVASEVGEGTEIEILLPI